MSASINMKITALGQEALFNAKNTGFDLELTHIQFGSGNRVVDGNEVALLNARGMAPVSAGSKISATQIRVSALFPGDIPDSYPVSEIGIWAGEPGSQGAVLFAYWAKESGHIAVMSKGVEFAWTHDLFVDAAVGGSITIVVDPSASTAVTMMNAHQADPDPHSSYWNDERGGIKIKAAMSDLDMNHATAGLLPVARGGTGIGAVAAGAYLMGADRAGLVARTPGQVFSDIGVSQAIGAAIQDVGLGTTYAGNGIGDLDDVTRGAGLYYTATGKGPKNWLGEGFVLHRVYGSAGFQLGNVYGSGVLQFRERAQNVWQKPITLANLDSPAFTGTPTASTPAAGDRSTRIATTAFVADYSLRRFSALALPATDVGPVFVVEFGEIWHWVITPGYAGYRSPTCGQIAYFATDKEPAGWLKANGTEASRQVFAGLFSIIGTRYGVGDGVTNFSLPDLRGEFIRSLDDSRGIDPGRGLGSNQSATAIRALIDNYYMHTTGTLAIGMRNVDGRLTGAGSESFTVGSDATFYISTTTQYNSGAGDNISHFVRPRNVALMAFIKI